MAPPTPLAQLRPATQFVPIEVRILHKWKPFRKWPHKSYLLIDAQGDIIQGLFDLKHEESFDAQVSLMACYRVERFATVRAPTQLKVAENRYAVRFGSSTTFTLISNLEGIPRFHFSFVDHTLLPTRVGNNELLTDYIGRVLAIENHGETADGLILKIKLGDSEDRDVYVTVWPEIGNALDWDAMMRTDCIVIVAVNSLKVTSFRDRIQLETTTATRFHINPDVQIAHDLAEMFGNADNQPIVGDAAPLTIERITRPFERNRTTIQSLMELDFTEITGTVFTCEATIKSFDADFAWFYTACPKCRKSMPNEEPVCLCSESETQEPVPMYYVHDVIEDDTGEARVTMFSHAINRLTGIECADMITTMGYNDPSELPAPIASLKFHKTVFQLAKPQFNFKGELGFAVSRVFEPPAPAFNLHDDPSDEAEKVLEKSRRVLRLTDEPRDDSSGDSYEECAEIENMSSTITQKESASNSPPVAAVKQKSMVKTPLAETPNSVVKQNPVMKTPVPQTPLEKTEASLSNAKRKLFGEGGHLTRNSKRVNTKP